MYEAFDKHMAALECNLPAELRGRMGQKVSRNRGPAVGAATTAVISTRLTKRRLAETGKVAFLLLPVQNRKPRVLHWMQSPGTNANELNSKATIQIVKKKKTGKRKYELNFAFECARACKSDYVFGLN